MPLDSADASMIRLFEVASCVPAKVIVVPFKATLNVIVSPLTASMITCLSDPAPESAVVVTTPATALWLNPRASKIDPITAVPEIKRRILLRCEFFVGRFLGGVNNGICRWAGWAAIEIEGLFDAYRRAARTVLPPCAQP